MKLKKYLRRGRGSNLGGGAMGVFMRRNRRGAATARSRGTRGRKKEKKKRIEEEEVTRFSPRSTSHTKAIGVTCHAHCFGATRQHVASAG
jgi:hypothetical protein